MGQFLSLVPGKVSPRPCSVRRTFKFHQRHVGRSRDSHLNEQPKRATDEFKH